ncbi:MAG: hypothetical protein ACT6QX_21030, partial [Sphingopyxis sp.]|uniref:hypothetical protein n=1 Tax=Sphingopyxis sp. TaxID=1908224 RepID=UPI0040381642
LIGDFLDKWLDLEDAAAIVDPSGSVMSALVAASGGAASTGSLPQDWSERVAAPIARTDVMNNRIRGIIDPRSPSQHQRAT